MRKNDFTGYILAGGKSSRMGRDKAFLQIEKKTFIENAVEILAPVCDQIKVVLNKSQIHFVEKIPVKTPHIFDIYENRGALGGIYTAFRDCESEFAIILAVDLPVVSSAAIEKLSEIAITFDKYSAFVPRQNDGRLQPLCAIYRAKDCLPEIENVFAAEESASVNFFLTNITKKIIEQNNLAGDKDIFLNVNKPQDFTYLKTKDNFEVKN